MSGYINNNAPIEYKPQLENNKLRNKFNDLNFKKQDSISDSTIMNRYQRSSEPEAEWMKWQGNSKSDFIQYNGNRNMLIAIGIVIALILSGIVFVAIMKLFIDNAVKDQTPPQFEVIATAQSTHTPPPVMEVTPTPEPEETAPEYVLIDNLPVAQEFNVAELHIGQWSVSGTRAFQNANQTYDSGLGMFLPSKSIDKEWGNDFITYNLNGMYEKIQFDIFVDTEGVYGIPSEYGLFDIYMYADGEKIFDSDHMYYDDIIDDRLLILPEGTLQLKIVLTQKKGSKGTLDVVIGDFFLYPYEY